MNEDEPFSLGAISLAPVNFFAIEVDCCKVSSLDPEALTSKFLLPDLSDLCCEDQFAQLFLGWNPSGIIAKVVVNKSIEHVVFPSPESGDSVELFFDTRDIKTAGFNNRFCHHFCFLPEPVEGIMAREVTRFRTEDAHTPCNPMDLQVSVLKKKLRGVYTMNIVIPAECLHGYDPDQFNRMGFSYRINRFGGPSQHFSVISAEYQIDQHPSMWSSLLLK